MACIVTITACIDCDLIHFNCYCRCWGAELWCSWS